MTDEVCVEINAGADIVSARAQARTLALELGFSRTDATLVATAVSEIVRNIILHVGRGEVVFRPLHEEQRYGLLVVARDAGPGIRDVEAALEQGFASSGGLGLGLAGARRLMDEFHVDSDTGTGTTVTMIKWRLRDELERLRERRARR